MSAQADVLLRIDRENGGRTEVLDGVVGKEVGAFIVDVDTYLGVTSTLTAGLDLVFHLSLKDGDNNSSEMHFVEPRRMSETDRQVRLLRLTYPCALTYFDQILAEVLNNGSPARHRISYNDFQQVRYH